MDSSLKKSGEKHLQNKEFGIEAKSDSDLNK